MTGDCDHNKADGILWASQEPYLQVPSLPSSALLEALSAAFSYPNIGIEITLAMLSRVGNSAADELSFNVRCAKTEEKTDTAKRLNTAEECAATLKKRIDDVIQSSKCFADRTDEQLAYTRLFIGSFRMEAPPYASYYLEENHLLNGRITQEIENVYRQFGLQVTPAPIAFNGDTDTASSQGVIIPADHLRYLLAFLSLLLRRFEETKETAFVNAYVDFRDDYILSWIDDFANLVRCNAENPYYPKLVSLIVDVLKGSIGELT